MPGEGGGGNSEEIGGVADAGTPRALSKKPDCGVGHDADTAAMAYTRSGAYHGCAKLPQRLAAALAYHDCLLELADGLYEFNRRL